MSTAAEMAKLFDIDLDESLSDSEESFEMKMNKGKKPSFEMKIQDIKTIMTPEQENDLIKKAAENAKNNIVSQPQTFEDDEKEEDLAVEDNAEDISNDIEKFQAELKKNTTPEQAVENKVKVVEEEINNQIRVETEENPLDLDALDLVAYKKIKEQYSQFVLYDGNKLFKDFYTYKVKVLKAALTRFPILPVQDLNKEIESIKVDHYLGTSNITPELVQTKIDQTYKCRVRLSELVIQAYQQFSYWERMKDLLTSKLWKDHDLKGTHRRDGLTLEHMFDIEDYYGMLKGYIESAQHVDSLLKAASDSLSRQLTCLQIKEQLVGFGKVDDSRRRDVKRTDHDNFDSISSGTVITAPKNSKEPISMNFGVDSKDEIANL